MTGPLERAAIDELVAMTGGDPTFMAELIDTFASDAVAMLGELDAAVGAGDDAALMRPAHSLKSNAATFGATALAELCRALEADARGGVVPDPAGRVAAIRAELETVSAALQAERDGLADGA